MKKFKLLVLSAAALALVACGGNNASSKSSDPIKESSSLVSSTEDESSESIESSEPSIESSEPSIESSESNESSKPSIESSEPSIESSESSVESSEPIELELMTPLDAINEFAYYFGVSPVEVDDGVYGLFAAFPAADYPADTMVTYAEMFTPEEFAAVVDWSVDEDNVHSAVYINDVDTVIEWYIYEDVVYVDGSGMIVEEPGDGISEVNATFIEIYTYTYDTIEVPEGEYNITYSLYVDPFTLNF